MAVARVRLNKIDAEAYESCFTAVFTTTSARHPEFSVGGFLQGIILDWSDQQLKGLSGAVGKESAEKVVKGCQVSKKY